MACKPYINYSFQVVDNFCWICLTFVGFPRHERSKQKGVFPGNPVTGIAFLDAASPSPPLSSSPCRDVRCKASTSASSWSSWHWCGSEPNPGSPCRCGRSHQDPWGFVALQSATNVDSRRQRIDFHTTKLKFFHWILQGFKWIKKATYFNCNYLLSIPA